MMSSPVSYLLHGEIFFLLLDEPSSFSLVRAPGLRVLGGERLGEKKENSAVVALLRVVKLT